ncbi:hypothetical protein [uncultured Tateyamaria sp.]|uniref:hypothetical protein n=1 Tax=uncultured Tateyamaria sp. TaxID=455651 RepID=UPI0026143730|nr:hypothetical protein [uncultured Tateyamaria sp.]
MSQPDAFPPPHIGLIDAWAKVRKAMAEFTLMADSVQAICTHDHAVQWDPKYFHHKRPDCQSHPMRVCVHCGLIEYAQRQLDPDSFDPDGPLFGSEILAVYEEGFRANHFSLPREAPKNRLDGEPAPKEIERTTP